MRAVLLLVVLALVACGSPVAPPRASLPIADDARDEPVAPPPERRVAAGAPLEAPEDGPCGGLAALAMDQEHRVLGDRLRLHLAADAEQSAPSHDIMSAPASSQHRELLWLRSGDARLAIVATELFRTGEADLTTQVEPVAPEGWRARSLTALDGLRGIALDPTPLRDDDGDVILQEAWLAGGDDLVRHILVVTSPGVAATGGCVELARRIVSGVSGGRRELALAGGERVLFGDLAIQVPPRHALVVDEGPDFSVYHVSPVVPLGAPSGSLGIYAGGHPSFRPEAGATTRTTTTLDRDVTWHDVALGSHAIIEGDDGLLHVFFRGDVSAVRTVLRTTAESLHRVSPAPRAPLCDGSVDRAALVTGAAPVDSPELAMLLQARRVALVASAMGEPQVPETAAYRRLLTRPEAPIAFLHLATHGSTAGRIYGLAGLRVVDPPTFRRVVCGVRDALETEVTVRDTCGESARASWSLIERAEAEAVRGEEHWGRSEWEGALVRGIVDVVGGGLPRVMALGTSRDREMDDAAWLAGSEGIEGLAATVVGSPPLGTRSRGVRVIPRAYGGFCTVRPDGRVACWGSNFSSSPERVTLLPDVVRQPLDLVDGALGCMLDASHERTCWFDPGRARHLVRERCGVTIGDGPVVRRFDDGPWRDLVHLSGRTCGLHQDGSLRCFAHDRASALDGVDRVGDSWRVAIEGRVDGAVDGYARDSYAWTREGRVFVLSREAPPREVGRFEDLSRIVAGGQGPVFAELQDGRVLAWRSSADDPSQYWHSFGPRHDEWVEVDELRGAQLSLSDYHGCARWPDGRARCWGSNRDGEIGPGNALQRSPRDVAALRGARELFLQPQVTCARMRDDVLRCIGLRVPSLAVEAVSPEHRGPLDIRVPR